MDFDVGREVKPARLSRKVREEDDPRRLNDFGQLNDLKTVEHYRDGKSVCLGSRLVCNQTRFQISKSTHLLPSYGVAILLRRCVT